MRVAVVTQFPEDPSRPHGGVESVSISLLQALSKHTDLELHIVTLDPSCTSVVLSEWAGISVHRLPKLGRWMLTGAIGSDRHQVATYVKQLAPSVVHAHDVYGLMVKALSIPRVFTIHGFIHADTLVEKQRLARVRSWLWYWAESASWADQPHIISISPYVRERLARIATGTIHDIDNPISESFFHIQRRERKGTILSAAAICPRKNTLSLIESLARLVALGVNVQLRLAGAVTDPVYGERVRESIRACGLEQHVLLLGQVDSAQMKQELAQASVFALVSLEENSPVAIEEAMAAGVPVVTSNGCGMPYLVRDGESGFLVHPHDSSDIAGRLGQLLEDDSLRARMSARSRQIAEDRFNPRAIARRTHEVYLRALRDNRHHNGRV